MPSVGTVVIEERVVVSSSAKSGGIVVQDKRTIVEVGSKQVEVLSVGQVGPPGPPGPPGAPGSGIDAQKIQGVNVSNTTPAGGNVLVFHAGVWTPEPLNGGYF